MFGVLFNLGISFADIFMGMEELLQKVEALEHRIAVHHVLSEFLNTVVEFLGHEMGAHLAAFYLRKPMNGVFQLKSVQGSCPLEIADEFSAKIQKAAQIPPWVSSAVRREITYHETFASQETWRSLSIPLLNLRSSRSEVMGVLHVVFLRKQLTRPVDQILIQGFSQMLAQNLAEVQALQTMRDHGYAKSLALSTPLPNGQESKKKLFSICQKFGEKFSLSQREQVELQIAAILRDIGYSKFDAGFVLHSKPLNEREWKRLKKHPVYGEEKGRLLYLPSSLTQTIRQHHEWVNGCGYPDQLCSDQISIPARILSVADAFNALTSDRPYRKAISAAKAIEIVDNMKGKQFDTEMIKLLPEVAKAG